MLSRGDGTLQRSEMRLTDLAHHVSIPDGIVSSDWPAISGMLDEMDYPLDGWQQGLGRVLFARRENGLYACGVGGAAISLPRQVGKTYSIAGLMFAYCALRADTLILWTAHRARTHNETFLSMCSLAERKAIAPYIDSIQRGAGKEGITFSNGSRILFGARENGFGRGFPQVDVIVFDEAQILTERALNDMIPATNASPNGLVIMMGTPPTPADPGDVFIGVRDLGLQGDPDTFYVEFSADKGDDLDSEETYLKANPSFPHRTSLASMQRMRKMLGSDESFSREALGIWDERAKGQKAFDFRVWNSRFNEPPNDGRVCFGIKFSADGSHAALGAAILPAGDDAVAYIEAIESRPMSDGTDWLVDFLVDRRDRTTQIVIDGRSGVGFFVAALKQAGIRGPIVKTPSAEEAVTAHTMFEQGVTQGHLSHGSQHELDAQIKNTTRRKIGNTGGFGWAPFSDGDVTFVEAVTLAYWGIKTTKRNPGRRQRFI